MTDATVYAVASGKGGVGKTTTAVNLGAGFAAAGRSVAVVDLDLGMANVGDFVTASPAGPTLHDVLAGDATLDDALSHATDRLDVIRGSDDLEAFGRADPTGIGDVLSALRLRYDIVVLDSGGGLSHDTALPLGLADEIIVVSTPEPAAIQNTRKTLDLAAKLDGTVAGLVLTRVGAGIDPDEIAGDLDLSLLGAVPEDGTVREAAEAGEPLLAFDRDSPAARSYLEIAYGLLGEPLPREVGEGSGVELSGAGEGGPGTEGMTPEAAAGEGEAVDPAAEHTDAAAGSTDAAAGSTDAAAESADAAAEPADTETEQGAGSGQTGEPAEPAPGAAGTEGTEEPAELKETEEPEEPEAEAMEEPEETTGSRSLLSRLTGGLFG
ncbi:MAG: MinD/ParA family protein [Halodesulfurarchaeum sp.]